GLLIAALPAPLGRIVMLSHVAEQLRWPDGRRVEIGGRERAGDTADARGTGHLIEFRLEAGIPVWRYDVEGLVLEKRAFLRHQPDTCGLICMLAGGPGRSELVLRPWVNFRGQELPVTEPLGWPYEFRSIGERCEVALKGRTLPVLRLLVVADAATFT